MSKPLKFHQTLNQPPRSIKHGKYRRANPSSYRGPTDRAGDGPGGSDEDGTVTITWSGGIAYDFAAEPKPPAVPYAGIRTGELIGHRLWWVIEGQLCSLAHRRLWQPDETVVGVTNEIAQQDAFGFNVIWGGTYAFADRTKCEPDVMQCAAGIAEWARLAEAWGATVPYWISGWNAYEEAKAVVVGTIKMWGDVVEHERGYRSEFAKMHSLDELYGDGDLDVLRARYGVRSLTTP